METKLESICYQPAWQTLNAMLSYKGTREAPHSLYDSAHDGNGRSQAGFIGIMRWTFFNRLKESHSDKTVENTYGYLTKNTRITHGIEKSHCADAYCIAGNLRAERLPEFLFQKQVRKHNRQIHKMTIGRGGIRKRQQTPFEVKGFRLFDKVRLGSEEGFIFGRSSSGYFDVRRLDGQKLSAGVSFKKLHLLEKRTTYLLCRKAPSVDGGDIRRRAPARTFRMVCPDPRCISSAPPAVLRRRQRQSTTATRAVFDSRRTQVLGSVPEACGS